MSADHLVHLPDELPAGALIRIRIEQFIDDAAVDRYQPHTEIGRLALAARKAYIGAGGKLLTADEINEEVRSRRGSVSND
ncbi:MAG: hypothetical protein GY862_02045 [Gammaproteobacteria bacterium]|nr:hypothetical protein [Gammaproteobacteria bacterium]